MRLYMNIIANLVKEYKFGTVVDKNFEKGAQKTYKNKQVGNSFQYLVTNHSTNTQNITRLLQNYHSYYKYVYYINTITSKRLIYLSYNL